MLNLFGPIKSRADAGEFLAPDGYKVLQKLIEEFQTKYWRAGETEEMGPKFKVLQGPDKIPGRSGKIVSMQNYSKEST